MARLAGEGLYVFYVLTGWYVVAEWRGGHSVRTSVVVAAQLQRLHHASTGGRVSRRSEVSAAHHSDHHQPRCTPRGVPHHVTVQHASPSVSYTHLTLPTILRV